MSATAPGPIAMNVPVDLIDEPDIAMRQSFDPAAMDDLVDSIRAHGVIQSLALVRAGERYRVAAGHRRSIAAVLAGLTEVPARVWPEGSPVEEILKFEENARREKVNPADEALYFMRLLEERCSGDVHKLCGMVGQKLSYVDSRLDLLRGHKEVLEAIGHRKISISVGQEFNKYKDRGMMLAHLKTACDAGATARQVIQWRTDYERMQDLYPQVEGPAVDAPVATGYTAPKMECCVCGPADDAYNLEFMYVHRGGPCKKLLQRALESFGGGGE
jgi:ParB family chromosome partitioning protein